MENEKYNDPVFVEAPHKEDFERFLDCFRDAGAEIDMTKIRASNQLYKGAFESVLYFLEREAIVIREGFRMPYSGMQGVIHFLKQLKKPYVEIRVKFINRSDENDYYFLIIDANGKRLMHNMGLGD